MGVYLRTRELKNKKISLYLKVIQQNNSWAISLGLFLEPDHTIKRRNEVFKKGEKALIAVYNALESGHRFNSIQELVHLIGQSNYKN